MIVTLRYKNATVPVECAAQAFKLYAVPSAYSDDGLAVCMWNAGELEPIPACLVADAALLAHFTVDGDTASPVFVAEEVEYA